MVDLTQLVQLQHTDPSLCLDIIESAFMYSEISTLPEARQSAMVETKYTDLSSFHRTTRQVMCSQSVSLVLGCLVDLYEACLMDQMDNVFVYDGSVTLLRFRNEGVEPTADTRSLFLDLRDIHQKAEEALVDTHNDQRWWVCWHFGRQEVSTIAMSILLLAFLVMDHVE